jgi:hypothetical protein
VAGPQSCIRAENWPEIVTIIRKKKERVENEKRVRWRGRSGEALLVLRSISSIFLISTLLIPILRCNESVISRFL